MWVINKILFVNQAKIKQLKYRGFYFNFRASVLDATALPTGPLSNNIIKLARVTWHWQG